MDLADANHSSGGQMMNPQHMNMASQPHMMTSHPGSMKIVYTLSDQ